MREESRAALKTSLGIYQSTSKLNCKSCFYHPIENICNIHQIVTEENEVCEKHKKDTKFKFINGGRMSPR
ncbi:hypothetical protein [Sutcliffiella sp. FSL R7-0096]|uniref:hypothetical protein n=1 Tax=Sutcliffiella sp. FSL R7-0096 TaxID=2921670 RepID=UPI00315A4561